MLQPHTTLRRMPALDGLRAVAVLLVMCVHFGKLQCGWIGVQLFFVISGFLITGILLKDQASEPGIGPYLKRFFWRRSLRIFPPYYLYLGTLALLYVFIRYPQGLMEDMPWLSGYAENWEQALLRSNAGEAPELGHLWSLCVEEQFYLVWPFFIYLTPRRALGPALLLLVTLGPAFRWLEGLWMMRQWTEGYVQAQSIQCMTGTHIDALALGSVMAYYRLHERLQKPLLWLAATGILFLAFGAYSYFGLRELGVDLRPSSLGYTYNTLLLNNHVWACSVVNLAMAAWVLVATGKPNILQKPLTNPILMGIGMVSYGIYLWHQLILIWVDRLFLALPFNTAIITDTALGTALRFALFLGLTLVWAKLMFRFVEQPFLKLKDSVKPERSAVTSR